MNIPLKFISEQQKTAFFASQKYQCLSGGYGSGKTLLICMKLLYLSITFPKTRWAIIRKELKTLKKTTMESFFKIFPSEIIARHSDSDGETELTNGSTFIWLGLDRFSEQDVKSLELNGAFIDQAEEIDESIYHHLDTRIGRWDMGEVPQYLLLDNPNWPRNSETGKLLVPTYYFLAVNPDTEFHWIYREFHPESDYWKDNNSKTHFFINMPSTSNTALRSDVLDAMMKKDPEFQKRYVMGEWGNSESQIHKIPKECLIEPSYDFLENFKRKALLYRSFDHGESAPSCCLWFATFNGVHICYREYYKPNTLISSHRAAISELSGDENYVASVADPDIFKKKAQKAGGRFSVSDEYLDRTITNAPIIAWTPGDNDEMGTRNRINEFLHRDKATLHPITGEPNSPRLYFVKRSQQHPSGCNMVLKETAGQRREKLGEINGKTIWGDAREKKIPDHAYDPLRYYIAMHTNKNDRVIKVLPKNSFMAYYREAQRLLDPAGGYGRY